MMGRRPCLLTRIFFELVVVLVSAIVLFLGLQSRPWPSEAIAAEKSLLGPILVDVAPQLQLSLGGVCR